MGIRTEGGTVIFRQADRFVVSALQGAACGDFTLPDHLPTDCRPGADHCSRCPDRMKSYLCFRVAPARTGRSMTAGQVFCVLPEQGFFLCPDRSGL